MSEPVRPAATARQTPVGPAENVRADDCRGSAEPGAQPVMTPPAGWQQAAGRARALSWFSLIWMSAEGLLGLIAGLGAQSVSLLGWALGSVIEGLASVIVIWRFTGTRTLSEVAEARAQRAVALSFFLLAPYLAVQAVHDLLTDHQARPSALGIVLTGASLLVMPALGVAKKGLGTTLRSAATAGEGAQNLICAGQAAAVLVGLAVTSKLGWSWADPSIALLLAGWAIKEGVGAWRGKVCC